MSDNPALLKPPFSDKDTTLEVITPELPSLLDSALSKTALLQNKRISTSLYFFHNKTNTNFAPLNIIF